MVPFSVPSVVFFFVPLHWLNDTFKQLFQYACPGCASVVFLTCRRNTSINVNVYTKNVSAGATSSDLVVRVKV